MREIRARLGQSDRIVISTEYRRRLGLEADGEIMMHLDEEGCISTPLLRPWRGCKVWCGATFRRGGACPES